MHEDATQSLNGTANAIERAASDPVGFPGLDEPHVEVEYSTAAVSLHLFYSCQQLADHIRNLSAALASALGK